MEAGARASDLFGRKVPRATEKVDSRKGEQRLGGKGRGPRSAGPQ